MAMYFVASEDEADESLWLDVLLSQLMVHFEKRRFSSSDEPTLYSSTGMDASLLHL